jgi:undecaprenyl pyrophosphate phosphatase UppP
MSDVVGICRMEERSKVRKALLALVVTVVMGLLGTAFGYDEMNGFSEIGAVVAVAVMGAFIIYFNEKKK